MSIKRTISTAVAAAFTAAALAAARGPAIVESADGLTSSRPTRECREPASRPARAHAGDESVRPAATVPSWNRLLVAYLCSPRAKLSDERPRAHAPAPRPLRTDLVTGRRGRPPSRRAPLPPCRPVMPLTLVTGPANAEKARVVLDGYARARAAAAPLLVVPTVADVEHLPPRAGRRRRRASASASSASRPAAARSRAAAASPAGRSTALQRERVAAAAIAAHAAGAPRPAPRRRPASRPRSSRLVDELEQARVDPPRFVAARCAPGRPASRRAPRFAEELGGARPRLPPRAGAHRPPRRRPAARRRRARRAARGPARAGARRRSSSTASTTSRRCSSTPSTRSPRRGADVIVSLTFEPGRTAFAARATLAPGAARARRDRGDRAPRSPTTTRHARPRCTTSSARCSSPRRARRADPGARGRRCSRAAASAPRSSWSPPRSRG